MDRDGQHVSPTVRILHNLKWVSSKFSPRTENLPLNVFLKPPTDVEPTTVKLIYESWTAPTKRKLYPVNSFQLFAQVKPVKRNWRKNLKRNINVWHRNLKPHNGFQFSILFFGSVETSLLRHSTITIKAARTKRWKIAIDCAMMQMVEINMTEWGGKRRGGGNFFRHVDSI